MNVYSRHVTADRKSISRMHINNGLEGACGWDSSSMLLLFISVVTVVATVVEEVQFGYMKMRNL